MDIEDLPAITIKPVEGLEVDKSKNIIEPIIDRATEVLGDKQEAMRWLGTPVRGLDFATPVSLLGTEECAQRINDILGQMEHGIW